MPCRQELGLFKAPGPHRAKLAGPQGHRKDDWVKAMEEGKTAGSGQSLPGLFDCTSKSSVGGRGIQSQVCNNRSSSLLGKVRASDRETRTKLRAVWSFTSHRTCYFHGAHYHLLFGKMGENTWPCSWSATPLKGHVNLGKPLLRLGFYICKKGHT